MSDKKEFNPYDSMGLPDPEEAKRYQEEIEASGNKLDYLIHKIFTTDEGREYLEIMKNSLMMTPTAQAGMEPLEVGIHEGVKQFIRNIILTIDKVEKGDD